MQLFIMITHLQKLGRYKYCSDKFPLFSKQNSSALGEVDLAMQSAQCLLPSEESITVVLRSLMESSIPFSFWVT